MDSIEVTRVIKAPARRIYEAWLDPEEHALMTNAAASAGEDGAYTAWDGYIEGRTVASQPYARIEQTWRTNEFPEGAPDSHLVVELTEVEGGTEVKLKHTGVPTGQGPQYETGWNEYYFDPMEKYFGSPREKLKEGVERLEEAAGKAGEALEHAVEQAGEALESAKKNVSKALESAKKQAKKQADKAVKTGKKVQKKVAAQAKSLGKKVRALVKGKKTAKAAKQPAPKKKAASGKRGAVSKKKSRR